MDYSSPVQIRKTNMVKDHCQTGARFQGNATQDNNSFVLNWGAAKFDVKFGSW